MKKLKLNEALLQQAERISREQQRAVLGGGYGGGGGSGGGCYTADCLNSSGVILGTINTYPVVCSYNGFTNACVNKYGGGNTVWAQTCC